MQNETICKALIGTETIALSSTGGVGSFELHAPSYITVMTLSRASASMDNVSFIKCVKQCAKNLSGIEVEIDKEKRTATIDDIFSNPECLAIANEIVENINRRIAVNNEAVKS